MPTPPLPATQTNLAAANDGTKSGSGGIPVAGAGFVKRIKRLAPYMRKYKANPPA